jgi:beta-mannosidase
MHYWQVWHASMPFSDYEKQFPRFMSEYGFQSFPQLETVNNYTTAADHDIHSPVMLAHQRHPRGNQLIREYMLRDYPEPKDFEAFLYVSQILQAEGIKIGAEHLRRIMPHNMGSLFWQINDCWPVASWSSIDYTGRWKALQYYARRFYSDLLVSPHEENGRLELFVVSDRLKQVPAELNVSLLDFKGNVLWNQRKSIAIAALTSSSYLSVPLETVLGAKERKDVFLLAELTVNGQAVSRNQYFFKPYKELALTQPQISVDVTRMAGGLRVRLSADNLARAVYLSAPKYAGFFVDNYFDLIPGREVELEFRTTAAITANEFREQLKIRSLVDAF